MSNLNIRNVPQELHDRVRLAAACGGLRIPKGALEKFVIQALRRAVEDPQPGFGLPRIKLCSTCFQKNLALAPVAGPRVVPASAFATSATTVDSREAMVQPSAIFSHLFDDRSPVLEGLMGAEADEIGVSPVAPVEDEATEPLSSQSVAFPEQQLEELGAVEVSPGLWVGSDAAYCPGLETLCSVLSAAKEPWHRQMVGYLTASAPEDNPERLVARRGNHMALNLIDVRKLGPGNCHYVPESVIEPALAFLAERLEAGAPVFVHCNQGRSRGPSIALLYLLRHGLLPAAEALPKFGRLYPNYLPSAGMQEYIRLKLGNVHPWPEGSKMEKHA